MICDGKAKALKLLLKIKEKLFIHICEKLRSIEI